ncbi:ABC transporter substrate-binding protein [Elioraea rosea]|uniref:ABC transporter substrate-binding protein n=1 Tax=Elioraea rosea TaxID=2492390 RepID=UPI001183391B|nr:ABC transporter substrate-binding protein [Elioraea rosea]
MRLTRRAALQAAAAAPLASPFILPRNAVAQQKPSELRLGISTFLSGPASVFGVPGRNAADLIIEQFNSSGGIGGVPLRSVVIDEAPGVDFLLGECRRLAQNEGVDMMLASISSGSCLAVAPLAEQLRMPTILWDCGTQRIFEENSYRYSVRTQANAVPEIVAPLLYLMRVKPDFRTLAVVNQDYAWGRDSWAIWKAAMDAIKPGVRVVAELFPRFGATDFSTEITRLQALRPDVILSTSWGGELDTFVRQAAERRLFERSTFVLPLAESSLERVGRTLPEGVIVGARGDHWFLHPTARDGELLKNFTQSYRQRFNLYPIYPTFHMAQALYGMKAGYEKAIAANGGSWPSREQVMDTMRGLEFQHLTGTMKIRDDGQGLEPMLMGVTRHVEAYNFPVLDQMILYPPDLTMNPTGTKGLDWVRLLTPAAVQRAPAPIAYRA